MLKNMCEEFPEFELKVSNKHFIMCSGYQLKHIGI